MRNYAANCLNGRADGKVACFKRKWATNDLVNDRTNDLKSVEKQQSTAKRRCMQASTAKRDRFNDIQSQLAFQSNCNQRNQCNAHERLKSKICYVCGLISKFYKITDSLVTHYKNKFGLDLVIDYFTPDTICGACRSNLSCRQKVHQFKFSKPIIWRPASNHHRDDLIDDSDCDCYFCLADEKVSLSELRELENLPQNSSCSLPLIDDISKMKEEIVNEPDGEHKDPNSHAMNSNHQSVDQNIDPNVLQLFNQIMNQTTNADLDQNREHQRSSLPTLSSAVSSTSEITDLLKNLREDIYFLCEKLDNKIDRLQNDVESIKTQQQSIASSLNSPAVLSKNSNN